MFVLKSVVVVCCAAWLLTQLGAGAKTGWSGVKLFLQLPLVKPVLALAAVYFLSSILAVVPSVSWWGSYRSAQGSIAFFCYAIIFLIAVSELRSAAQLQRLQFALVLVSLPVSGYALLQYFGSDFVPWNAYSGRSSGSMGNPIFLGGYLVMIIPVTAGIMLDEMKKPPNERARMFIWCCGCALLLQLAALACTQSRGPLLGLAFAIYFCLFIFLLLNRGSREFRLFDCIAAAGLGVSVPALLFAAALAASELSPPRAGLACFTGVLALIAITYVFLWRTRWGRNWLWLAWAVQTLALTLILAINPSGAVQKGFHLSSSLGRVTQFSGGSVDFRKEIWNIGIRFMESGGPALLTDDIRDPYHSLRRVIGYGPSSTWLAANIHATPSLVRAYAHESLEQMHNEVFDRLVATGLAGVLVYLGIIAAGFYYALRYLGLISDRGGNARYLLLSVMGCLAGVLIPYAAGVPYLAGIGVIGGLLAGIFACAAWGGIRNGDSGRVIGARQLFVLGVLGALTAHVVEIAVGIAVVSTRLYFYLFLAVISVVSSRDLAGSPAKRGRQTRARWDLSPFLPYVAISSFVIFVESWCFIFNTTREQSALTIFLRVWFAGYSGEQTNVHVPGALMLLILTICGSIGLMRSGSPYSAAEKPFLRNMLLYLFLVWIVAGMLSTMFWTVSEGASPTEVSLHSEARITMFVCGLLLLMMIEAFTLFAQERTRREFTVVGKSETLAGFFAAACAIFAIWGLTLRPAWADIARGVAGSYERAGNRTAAAQLHERSAKLAPRVVPYQLSAGLARGESAAWDQAEFEKAYLFFRKAAALNPLDPTVYRSIGTFHLEGAEQSQDPERRVAEIKTGIAHFQKAARLAPVYPAAYTDIGRCYFLLGDYVKANRLYQKSLQMDPNHSRTYMLLGEMQYQQKKLEEALQSFRKADWTSRHNTEARKNIGAVLALLGRKDEAIRTYSDLLRRRPNDSTLLTRLALLYFGKGDYGRGMTFARRAYDATPGAARGSLDGFIEQLKEQVR